MSDQQVNAVRDALIASVPEQESLIRTRDQVVERWCKEHGVDKGDITIAQLLEIRALPEWPNAS